MKEYSVTSARVPPRVVGTDDGKSSAPLPPEGQGWLFVGFSATPEWLYSMWAREVPVDLPAQPPPGHVPLPALTRALEYFGGLDAADRKSVLSELHVIRNSMTTGQSGRATLATLLHGLEEVHEARKSAGK